MDVQRTTFLILSLIISVLNSFSQKINNTKLLDSVSYFIKKSNEEITPLKEKLFFLNKAYIGVQNYPNDTSKCKALDKIAFKSYKLKYNSLFEKVNNEELNLALQLKDTFYIGYAHWNYADFYNNPGSEDIAYHHYNEALTSFTTLNKDYEVGSVLFSMAAIKGKYRDYSGSEILMVKAIKRFKKINNNKNLFAAYNYLGFLQSDIKEYDRGLYYYDIASRYFDKLKEGEKPSYSLNNNIANCYLDKKEYKKALGLYNLGLKSELNSISSTANLLTNKARCKLLMKDTLGVKENLFYAFHIRDSIGDKLKITNSKSVISDYYKYAKDTINAIKYAKEANVLASEIKNSVEYLTTLQQLANVDIQNSKKYLDRYIVYNDSLLTEERRTQNKFTRIEFETDAYIEEAEKLSHQNLLITIASIATILLLSMLYFIRVQKVNNAKLRSEADEQKANEEVYILSMQQQTKLEEERVNERNRISEELHDGILGKLFGTRVNLGFLAMQMNSDTQEKHQAFLDELQVIEKEIREVSHKLSDNFDDANISFSSILKQLLKDKSEIGGFKYEYRQGKNIKWNTVNEITKANIYRIVQESIQNVIKHAKAQNIVLEILSTEDHLKIILKDDGVGFDMKTSKNGIGIKNIKSRLKKLSGTLKIHSEINKGTELIMQIPFNQIIKEDKVIKM